LFGFTGDLLSCFGFLGVSNAALLKRQGGGGLLLGALGIPAGLNDGLALLLAVVAPQHQASTCSGQCYRGAGQAVGQRH
jgi:hypothetical protein